LSGPDVAPRPRGSARTFHVQGSDASEAVSLHGRNGGLSASALGAESHLQPRRNV